MPCADWERLTTFYHFPQPHWQHLHTTNPVESPLAVVQFRTDADERLRRCPTNATAVMWQMLFVSQQTFRRVKHPELVAIA